MGDKAKNILVWLVVALTLVLWVSLFLVFALPLP
jgi:membrane-anchored glycerophosphoryl diester phosphodiesterase (GDPDase)